MKRRSMFDESRGARFLGYEKAENHEQSGSTGGDWRKKPWQKHPTRKGTPGSKLLRKYPLLGYDKSATKPGAKRRAA